MGFDLFCMGLIALLFGLVLAFAGYRMLRFDIQKHAVMVITAVGGTSAIIFTLLAAFGNLSPLALLLNPVRLAIENSFWWLLFFLVVAGAGIFVQIMASRAYEIEEYNRYATW